MLEKSCTEFLNMLSSKEPVPGGGGASAYVGALGMALGSMVGNLTLGKKKYQDVEEEIKELLVKSEAVMIELIKLVDKDAEAFFPLSQAYGLPKSTDEEKAVRERVLQGALVGATMVPLDIARSCCKAIDLLEEPATPSGKHLQIPTVLVRRPSCGCDDGGIAQPLVDLLTAT